jgi:hypothetical protein
MSKLRILRLLGISAIAAVSLASTGSADADGGSIIPNTFFTQLPGVATTVPAQNASAIGMAQKNGQATGAYVTQSNRGTWLFPPNQTGGGAND